MKNSKRIEDVKDYYDQNVIGKLKGFVYGNKRVETAWLEMNTWISNPTNILEVGCGIGDISWRLSKKFPEAMVLGFDVSEKSIEIATKLFNNSGLSFQQADDISLLKTDQSKFDLIFLFDVFEHIPIELRNNLFAFIRKNLSDDGIIFISCPTIEHQNYLREYQPGGLQPIDEDISIKEVVEFSDQIQLPLLFYKEVSVWNTGDYLHAVFGSRKYKSISQENILLPLSIKKNVVQKIFAKKPNNSMEDINARGNLIKKILGEESYHSIFKNT